MRRSSLHTSATSKKYKKRFKKKGGERGKSTRIPKSAKKQPHKLSTRRSSSSANLISLKKRKHISSRTNPLRNSYSFRAISKKKKKQKKKKIRSRNKLKHKNNLFSLNTDIISFITNFFSTPEEVFSLMLVAKCYRNFFLNKTLYLGCENVQFSVRDPNIFKSVYKPFHFVKVLKLTSNLLKMEKLDVKNFRKFPKLKYLIVNAKLFSLLKLFPIKKVKKGIKVVSPSLNKLSLRCELPISIVKKSKSNQKVFRGIRELILIRTFFKTKFFYYMPNLTKLTINNYDDFGQYVVGGGEVQEEDFRELKCLKYLYLTTRRIIAFLRCIPSENLETLALLNYGGIIKESNTYNDDFKRFKKLKNLAINWMDQCEVICGPSKLKKLQITGGVCSKLEFEKISKSICNLCELEELNITYHTKTVMFESNFFENLKNLKILKLNSGSKSFESVKDVFTNNFECLVKLQSLNLVEVNDIDVNALKSLKILRLKECVFDSCIGFDCIAFSRLFVPVSNESSKLKSLVIVVSLNERARTIPPSLENNKFMIENFVNLCSLKLWRVNSIKNIVSLDNLLRLSVKECECLEIIDLKNLIFFRSDECDRVVKVLAPKLETLILQRTNYGFRNIDYENVKTPFKKDSVLLKKVVLKNYYFITDSFFSGLKHLTTLKIDGNHLCSNRMFYELKKIKYLSLSNFNENIGDNGIKNIIDTIVHLEIFLFVKNRICKITTKYFGKMKRLLRLKIKTNRTGKIKYDIDNAKMLLEVFHHKRNELFLDVNYFCFMGIYHQNSGENPLFYS